MALITIQANFMAWIRDDGYNYPESNQLTATGKFDLASTYRVNNSYYIFDIPTNLQKVNAAELHFSAVHYESADASEPLAIYDVSTPIAELTHNHTNSDYGLNPSIFQDMQTGTQFGTGSISASLVGGDLAISLNSAAIDALYLASGSELAFGMTATDIAGDYRQLFGFNSNIAGYPGYPVVFGYQELWISTVPVPPAMVFFTSGLLMLAAYFKSVRAGR